jgi:predicted small secreted protein
MKKIIVFILTLVLAAAVFSACQTAQKASSDSSQSSETSTTLPNPFTEYESWDKLLTAAGESYEKPTALPEGYTEKEYTIMNSNDSSSFAQITYINAEEKELTYRVSATISVTELNGDSNQYTDQKTLTVGDLTVSYQGNDSTASVATWKNASMNFCIMSQEALTEQQLSDMISSIK